MNFKCYDVVEIQGKRYVVIEVISYQEFIIEKTVNYTLNDEILIGDNFSNYVSLSLNLYNIITFKIHSLDSSSTIAFKSLISSFVNGRSNKSGRNNRVRFKASFCRHVAMFL